MNRIYSKYITLVYEGNSFPLGVSGIKMMHSVMKRNQLKEDLNKNRISVEYTFDNTHSIQYLVLKWITIKLGLIEM